MLSHAPFSHNILRNLTVAFGSIFDSIQIRRFNPAGAEIERIGIPIAYGPKEKFLVRLAEGIKTEKKAAITLPRMSFLISGYNYDPERQGNPIHKNLKLKDGSNYYAHFKPVPYNIDFELAIMTKNHNDGNQIVEQIIPFFTPQWIVTLKTVPLLDLEDDIPIILQSVQYDQAYEGNYTDRRALIWTLGFRAKAWFYKPVEHAGLIRKVQVDFLIPPNLNSDILIDENEMVKAPRSARVTVEPDPIDANPQDDYGYSIDIEEFDDGKKYNSVTGTDEPIEE